MRAKFGVLQQTQDLHLQAKLHLNVFIVSASGGQKPQFWANFVILGGSCADRISPIRAKFGMLHQTHGLRVYGQTHGIRLLAKFRLDRFILSPSDGGNPKFYHFVDFGILWCCQLAAI